MRVTSLIRLLTRSLRFLRVIDPSLAECCNVLQFVPTR